MIKKILISQPKPQSANNGYSAVAKRRGVDVFFHQFIRIEPISTREFRDQKVDINKHSAVIFSSRHAIDNFFKVCEQVRVKPAETMKYFALSERIILYIQNFIPYRKRKVFFGETGRWPELLTVMEKHRGEKFLVPMSDGRNEQVSKILDDAGFQHTDSVMYRTVPNEFPAGQKLEDFDMIVLFTPAGVQSLVQNFPNWEQGDVKLVGFGEATAKAILDAGLRLDLTNTGQSLNITECLDKYLKEQNRK